MNTETIPRISVKEELKTYFSFRGLALLLLMAGVGCAAQALTLNLGWDAGSSFPLISLFASLLTSATILVIASVVARTGVSAARHNRVASLLVVLAVAKAVLATTEAALAAIFGTPQVIQAGIACAVFMAAGLLVELLRGSRTGGAK